MKLSGAVLLLASGVAMSVSVDEFDQAMSKHRMSLPLRSKAARQAALDATAQTIAEHNANPHRTYDMKYNSLSDYSDDEYSALLNTKPDTVHTPNEPNHHYRLQHEVSVQSTATSTYATSIDWSTKDGGKYVTPVKNQGICGSCWAFTAASALESMTAIASNSQAIPLSVEQILSCSTSLQHVSSAYANNMISSAKGCNGGMTFLAFEYLKQKDPHGLTCDALSPYRMKVSSDSSSLSSSICTNVDVYSKWSTGTSSYLSIQNSQDDVMKALQNGPLSISIDASGKGFRNYGSGIYDASDCKSDGVTVDHAVMIMGYGQTDDGQLYWIIRNSWGTIWGENGQMRMKRSLTESKSGPCNAFLYATQPTGLSQVSSSKCLTSSPSLNQTFGEVSLNFMPSGSSQGFLFFGVSSIIAFLGVVGLLLGEWRMRSAFPKQTYVESFLNHQLPNREQLVAHMAKKKVKGENIV
ncbi:cysteine protease family C01A [Thraustotheca clavata]|uniref:Cysteine protease family C01A n=1 Tax=Thraustotheca clavata TaxID=74557 RepID=A0A1V9ZCI5_9STRA|nr:cysteine protease family C01A [Thraustotheca clavata]